MLTAMPRASPRIFKTEKNLSLRKTRIKNLRWVVSMGVGFKRLISPKLGSALFQQQCRPVKAVRIVLTCGTFVFR